MKTVLPDPEDDKRVTNTPSMPCSSGKAFRCCNATTQPRLNWLSADSGSPNMILQWGSHSPEPPVRSIQTASLHTKPQHAVKNRALLPFCVCSLLLFEIIPAGSERHQRWSRWPCNRLIVKADASQAMGMRMQEGGRQDLLYGWRRDWLSLSKANCNQIL